MHELDVTLVLRGLNRAIFSCGDIFQDTFVDIAQD